MQPRLMILKHHLSTGVPRAGAIREREFAHPVVVHTPSVFHLSQKERKNDSFSKFKTDHIDLDEDDGRQLTRNITV